MLWRMFQASRVSGFGICGRWRNWVPAGGYIPLGYTSSRPQWVLGVFSTHFGIQEQINPMKKNLINLRGPWEYHKIIIWKFKKYPPQSGSSETWTSPYTIQRDGTRVIKWEKILYYPGHPWMDNCCPHYKMKEAEWELSVRMEADVWV